MTITKQENGSELTISVEGRLDTVTAPVLDNEIKERISGLTLLRLDFSRLEYISSAGLRVLLSAQKVMNHQGKLVISNAGGSVMEVFDITGFCDILNIE